MDPTQIVLLSVIIVLAIFLVILGWNAFFLLRDFRKTLNRANQLIDESRDLVGQVKKPVESAGNLITAVTAGIGISQLLKKVTKEETKNERK